jgi:DNA-binding winged helix-turn-helix (wHTH) protein/GTPase SAR1 family protein
MTEYQFPETVFPAAPIRANDLSTLVRWLQRGHCCALVGISNSGKSLLLKSLQHPEVLQRYNRGDTPLPLTVFVDCYEITDDPQAFYELILRGILEGLSTRDDTSSIVEHLRDLHSKILENTSEVAVRSLLAESVSLVIHRGKYPIVLILDEIDDAFEQLPSWPFRQLRTLRDSYGERLCYIVGSSRRLDQICEDEDSYEFRELFHLQVLTLQQLSRADARALIDYLVEKSGRALDDQRVSLILELSGGHPGLIERTCEALHNIDDEEVDVHAFLEDAFDHVAIEKECRRLWLELDGKEQEDLLTLIADGLTSLDEDQQHHLEERGLIVARDGGDLHIFSPLLERFIREEALRQHQIVLNGVRYDAKTGQIWVDDRDVTLELSEQQRKLLIFMYENAGAVCTHDQISMEIYGVGIGVSPAAIQALITRLRKKIEPDWKDPKYIVNVPGVGYLLEEPE